MPKYQKTHYVLSLFVCLIPLALVAGAAVMEFFIISSCFTFFFLNSRKIGLDYYKKIYFIIFILFSFYLILSSILSENVFNSLRNTLLYFRFGVLVILILYLLDNFEKFKILFFYSITATLVIVIFASIVDFFLFYDHFKVTRLSGLFGEEQVQGSYLLRITPLFILTYFYNKEFLNKKFFIIFYLILSLVFILIILSAERSSIFLLFIGIFLTFFFLKIKIKKIILCCIFFSSILASVFILNPTVKERVIDKTYNSFFSKHDKDLNYKKGLNIFSQGHQGHFQSAIEMFKQNYLIGVGVRNFRNECKKEIYKKIGMYHCSTHPHNTYLQILSETGLIGFLFFMIFLVFIFNKGYQYIKNIYTNHKAINVNYGLCFVFILVNFFPLTTTGSFFNNWLSTLYFMPIAFLLHELNYKK
jgi:O-antigen ligase|tara:strand:- start:192 stop:1439 length:1248 start_codon:yes stop_codon:yes gene_type:complete